MLIRHLAGALLLALVSGAHASPFQFSPDGQEATDEATGLTWRRCPEGMRWDGATCGGEPATFVYPQAIAHAQKQAASSSRWRLPTKQELLALADTAQKEPGLHARAFPATPPVQFWSSTPYARDGVRASTIHFSRGMELIDYRSRFFPVRLVRGKP